MPIETTQSADGTRTLYHVLDSNGTLLADIDVAEEIIDATGTLRVSWLFEPKTAINFGESEGWIEYRK